MYDLYADGIPVYKIMQYNVQYLISNEEKGKTTQ